LDYCCTKIDGNFEEFSGFHEWHPLANEMKNLRALLRDERGNVESAMVLVPLLILFLVGTQIASAAYLRNSVRMLAQDDATTRAISGDFKIEDEFTHIDSSGDGQSLDLLITHRAHSIVDLVPNFLGAASGNRKVDLYGFAVVENQR
jgi:hypothetical protein